MTVSGSLAGYAIEDETGQRLLYWGAGSAIWNNDGDVVKVLDAQGHVLLSQSY